MQTFPDSTRPLAPLVITMQCQNIYNEYKFKKKGGGDHARMTALETVIVHSLNL